MKRALCTANVICEVEGVPFEAQDFRPAICRQVVNI